MPPRTEADDIADFCARLMGTPASAPFADQKNAAMAGVLLEAYVKLKKANEPPKEPRGRQAFDDAIYAEPFMVYVIRNGSNGSAYVGSTTQGFTARYPGGRWWEPAVCRNPRMLEDVLTYGLASFRVALYPCSDEVEMLRKEAELINVHRFFTYNFKLEPANAQ